MNNKLIKYAARVSRYCKYIYFNESFRFLWTVFNLDK